MTKLLYTASALAVILPGAALAQQELQHPVQHGQMDNGQMQCCEQDANGETHCRQMDPSQMGNGAMPHEQMPNHSGMDQANTCQGQLMAQGHMMNHGQMDHGTMMGHGQMDNGQMPHQGHDDPQGDTGTAEQDDDSRQ